MTATYLSFVFMTAALLSLWVDKRPKVWGSLLGLSLYFGCLSGMIDWIGLIPLGALLSLWIYYERQPNALLFLMIAILSICFKLHLFAGFHPVQIQSKFKIGLEGALNGLFPLAFFVPLSRSTKDWRDVWKGTLVGLGGIAMLAILATSAKATHWNFKLPSEMLLRTWSNLILTSIPEEGFYRGFLQVKLSRLFQNKKGGDIIALILTSLLFTAAHFYWAPNSAILSFVFLASLLYGGVYLLTKRIESAIFCHFLLNLIHMVFFNYHG